MQTLLPAVVPTRLFPRAVAASSAAQQVATITGPAVGGLIYALNPTAVYAICFTMFAVAATQLAFLKYDHVATRTPVTLAGFFGGISYIRQNRILLGIIVLDLFAVLLGGAAALLPIFAKDVFDVGPTGLGVLRAAPAVGALLITVGLTTWSFTRRVGHIEFVAVAVFGVATIVFASTGSFWLAWIALAIMGGADAISVVIRMTLLQLETPGRHARPRQRRQFAVRQHVEPDRRFPRRRGRELHRRDAGGAGRRHRHALGRAALHAAVPRALPRRELPRQTRQVTLAC